MKISNKFTVKKRGSARSRPCVSRFWYRLYSHVGYLKTMAQYVPTNIFRVSFWKLGHLSSPIRFLEFLVWRKFWILETGCLDIRQPHFQTSSIFRVICCTVREVG